MSKKEPFMVFSGTKSRYLAEKICASLGCELGMMNIEHFADGEFAVSYEESIRGHDVLVQSTFPNSDNLMELLLMIDATETCFRKKRNRRNSLFWMGASRSKRQTACFNRSQTGCRFVKCSGNRSFDYDGFAC